MTTPTKKKRKAPVPPGKKPSVRQHRRERLQLLADRIKKVLREMPHVVDLHGELEENLLEVQFLEAENDLLTAQLARVRRNRAASLEKAQDLASRLMALLYGTFGLERLREMGLHVTPGGRGLRQPGGTPSQVN